MYFKLSLVKRRLLLVSSYGDVVPTPLIEALHNDVMVRKDVSGVDCCLASAG